MPNVVCWKTEVWDPSARIFTLAFFTKLESGRSIADAFAAAKTAVMCETHDGDIPGPYTIQIPGLPRGRIPSQVPMYELRGPGSPTKMTSFNPVPQAAGIPVLIQ